MSTPTPQQLFDLHLAPLGIQARVIDRDHSVGFQLFRAGEAITRRWRIKLTWRDRIAQLQSLLPSIAQQFR